MNKKIRKFLTMLLLFGVIVMVSTLAYAESNYPDYPAWFGTVSEPEFIQELLDAIYSVPFATDLLEINNVKLTLVGCDGWIESVIYGDPSVAVKGFTTYDYRNVYIESFTRNNYLELYLNKGVDPEILTGMTNEDISRRASIDTALHELGHIVDYWYHRTTTYTSLIYEGEYAPDGFGVNFYNIWAAEYGSYMQTSEYAVDARRVPANINSTQEYFASAFACYVLYPEELEEFCPQTYAFIKLIFDDYEMRGCLPGYEVD